MGFRAAASKKLSLLCQAVPLQEIALQLDGRAWLSCFEGLQPCNLNPTGGVRGFGVDPQWFLIVSSLSYLLA